MHRCDFDRLVQVGALDHVEAAHLFLGLRVRPVGDEHLAVAPPYRRRVAGRAQPVADQPRAAALHLVEPGLYVQFLRVGLERSLDADQQQVLHGSSSMLGFTRYDERQPPASTNPEEFFRSLPWGTADDPLPCDLAVLVATVAETGRE